jgi:hypothetical protein
MLLKCLREEKGTNFILALCAIGEENAGDFENDYDKGKKSGNYS